MRRLVAASLLVVAAAGCRTYPPLEPVRLAALETDLGQLLLVGFEGTEAEGNQAVERLLCETRVGGVVLFARNITGDEQAGRLTRALAERARACTGRPLLIAVDAEGGQVMRLGPGAGFAATLSAGELGESNDFTLTELEARRIGRMLRSAGVNWNLAPVVDVGYEPRNPVIVGAARSFSANPFLVTEHARAFIQATRSIGLRMADPRFWARAASVKAPTLVIHGGLDRLIPPAAARDLVRRRPGWELEIIAGAGHVPMLETPDLFMSVLEGWGPYRIPSQPAAAS